jgi:hypothetical protein
MLLAIRAGIIKGVPLCPEFLIVNKYIHTLDKNVISNSLKAHPVNAHKIYSKINQHKKTLNTK